MQAQTQRMLWRCRRGLLELDLVLPEFVKQHYAALSRQQKEAFNQLLDYPDNDLWSLITGNKEIENTDIANTAQQAVLSILRKAALSGKS